MCSVQYGCSLVPWFRAFPVCCWGIFWLILRSFQLPLLLLVLLLFLHFTRAILLLLLLLLMLLCIGQVILKSLVFCSRRKSFCYPLFWDDAVALRRQGGSLYSYMYRYCGVVSRSDGASHCVLHACLNVCTVGCRDPRGSVIRCKEKDDTLLSFLLARAGGRSFQITRYIALAEDTMAAPSESSEQLLAAWLRYNSIT